MGLGVLHRQLTKALGAGDVVVAVHGGAGEPDGAHDVGANGPSDLARLDGEADQLAGAVGDAAEVDAGVGAAPRGQRPAGGDGALLHELREPLAHPEGLLPALGAGVDEVAVEDLPAAEQLDLVQGRLDVEAAGQLGEAIADHRELGDEDRLPGKASRQLAGVGLVGLERVDVADQLPVGHLRRLPQGVDDGLVAGAAVACVSAEDRD